MERFIYDDCYWRRPCFTYHEKIGWLYISNLTARIYHDRQYYLLKTNSSGFRSNYEFSLKKKEGTKRLILLGDSYTAGDGVGNNERFSDLLSQKSGLGVMNFGLSNTGTDQQLLIYENIAKDYDADGYIFAVLVENISRIGQKCRPSFNYKEELLSYRPKPYFVLQDEELILYHFPVPNEKRSENDIGDWNPQFNIYNPEYPREEFGIYRQSDSSQWKLMKAILGRFISQVGGKPVFIMPLPMYHHYIGNDPPVYLERFRELQDISKQVYLVDVLPNFLSLDVHERLKLRTPNDPHYTPLGHSLVFKAIYDTLEKSSPALLCSGEKI